MLKTESKSQLTENQGQNFSRWPLETRVKRGQAAIGGNGWRTGSRPPASCGLHLFAVRWCVRLCGEDVKNVKLSRFILISFANSRLAIYLYTMKATQVKVSKQTADMVNMVNYSMFRPFSFICNDLSHVAFVIKSEYRFDQLSTKLQFINKGDCFFAVNRGEAIFDLMFKNEGEGFRLYRLTDEGYKKMGL